MTKLVDAEKDTARFASRMSDFVPMHAAYARLFMSVEQFKTGKGSTGKGAKGTSADPYRDPHDPDEQGVWRTINGNRVFIRDGETVEQALERDIGKDIDGDGKVKKDGKKDDKKKKKKDDEKKDEDASKALAKAARERLAREREEQAVKPADWDKDKAEYERQLEELLDKIDAGEAENSELDALFRAEAERRSKLDVGEDKDGTRQEQLSKLLDPWGRGAGKLKLDDGTEVYRLPNERIIDKDGNVRPLSSIQTEDHVYLDDYVRVDPQTNEVQSLGKSGWEKGTQAAGPMAEAKYHDYLVAQGVRDPTPMAVGPGAPGFKDEDSEESADEETGWTDEQINEALKATGLSDEELEELNEDDIQKILDKAEKPAASKVSAPTGKHDPTVKPSETWATVRPEGMDKLAADAAKDPSMLDRVVKEQVSLNDTLVLDGNPAWTRVKADMINAELEAQGLPDRLVITNTGAQAWVKSDAEREAVEGWVGTSVVATSLRGEIEMPEWHREWVENLDRVIDRSELKEDLVVYRGLKLEGRESTKQMIQEFRGPGSRFMDESFTSWAQSPQVAEEFSGAHARDMQFSGKSDKYAVMELRLPAGTKALDLGGAEQEILLPRGLVLENTGQLNRYGHMIVKAVPADKDD